MLRSGDMEPPVFQGTFDEWAAAFIQCMADRGFEVELGDPADGDSVRSDVSAEQRPAYMAATEECDMVVGILPSEPLTSEEISAEYDRQLGIAQCLREIGYPVTDPPSRELYVADYNSPEGLHWEAYLAVLDTMTRQDYLNAAAVCPRFD